MVGFNYVIELVPDKKYGALDPDTGEWNGIVRQILEKVHTIDYLIIKLNRILIYQDIQNKNNLLN